MTQIDACAAPLRGWNHFNCWLGSAVRDFPSFRVPNRPWPAVKLQPKRAITLAEHQKIIEREKNPARQNFYELRWHLGGSQTDIADLNTR